MGVGMVLDLPPGPQDNSDKGTVYVGIPYSKRNNPDGDHYWLRDRSMGCLKNGKVIAVILNGIWVAPHFETFRINYAFTPVRKPQNM